MKDNKINVDLIVPSLGVTYNLFIPVNKTVGELIVILNNTINELTNCFPSNNNLVLFDINEGKVYNIDEEIIETNIKNSSVLALI